MCVKENGMVQKQKMTTEEKLDIIMKAHEYSEEGSQIAP
jgi:hypothetical protein